MSSVDYVLMFCLQFGAMCVGRVASFLPSQHGRRASSSEVQATGTAAVKRVTGTSDTAAVSLGSAFYQSRHYSHYSSHIATISNELWYQLTLPSGNFFRNWSVLLVSPNTNCGGSDTTLILAPLYWAAMSALYARKFSGKVYNVYKTKHHTIHQFLSYSHFVQLKAN